jgi:UDP-N-acetyl-D-galactosamine dehydrogenase
VDPYYLTHKAEMIGYHPQVILAGRRVNDGMGKYIAETTIKKIIAAGSVIKGAKVNVLGLTFKENCADLRNSKVIDIIRELQSYGVEVSVTDAYANAEEAMQEYGVRLMSWEEIPKANALVVAVAHRKYQALSMHEIADKLDAGGIFVDVKALFNKVPLQEAGFAVWRL